MVDQNFRWPEGLTPVNVGERKFIRIEDSSLSNLGLKMHVKKKGYKHLDKIIEAHGKCNYGVVSHLLFQTTFDFLTRSAS